MERDLLWATSFRRWIFYLKEFVVQARLIAVNETVKHLKSETSTQKIIAGITEWIPKALSPFEALLTKWLVADYVFLDREFFKIDAHIFYYTIWITTERETIKFPVVIEIKEAFSFTDFSSKYVFNSWRLKNAGFKVKPQPINSKKAAIFKFSSKKGAKIDLIRILDGLFSPKNTTKDV